MTQPVRLQLSRKKGFSLQAWSREVNGLPAVRVDRASGFGNPFPILKTKETHMGQTTDIWIVGTGNGPAMWINRDAEEARAVSVKAFSAWIDAPGQDGLRARVSMALRGKNLACWCALDRGPCHADVLLELAARP